MNSHYVRINAQHEMREIVRATIKERGYTQDRAAREGGIKLSRLVSCLGANSWFREEEVAALAKLLDCDYEDLVAGSIFKGDVRARGVEFDYKPGTPKPTSPAESTYSPFQNRALCCYCGTLRTRPDDGVRIDDGETDARTPAKSTMYAYCVHCDEEMLHALVTPSGARGHREEKDRAPSLARLAEIERDEELARVRAFAVAIEVTGAMPRFSRSVGPAHYEIQLRDGRWVVKINANLPASMQAVAIRNAWKAIAADDFGTLDPRECGIVYTLHEANWEKAAQKLVTDVERFLPVERERMLLDLRDEVHAGDEWLETREADR